MRDFGAYLPNYRLTSLSGINTDIVSPSNQFVTSDYLSTSTVSATFPESDTSHFGKGKLSMHSKPHFESICESKMTDLNEKFSLITLYIGVELLVFVLVGILAFILLAKHIKEYYNMSQRENEVRFRERSISTGSNGNSNQLLEELGLDEKNYDSEDYYSDSFISYYAGDTDVKESMDHYYADEVTGEPKHHPGDAEDFSFDNTYMSSLQSSAAPKNLSNSPFVVRKFRTGKRLSSCSINTYEESCKLKQNCPEYLETYLNNCLGNENIANTEDVEVDFDELDIDQEYIEIHTAEEITERIGTIRVAISLELDGVNDIVKEVFTKHNIWCRLLDSEETENRLRRAAFQLISDLVQYQDETEVLDGEIYFQLAHSMLKGVYHLISRPQETTVDLFGSTMRSLYYVTASIAMQDFLDMFFEKWYRGRQYEKLWEVKCEIFKLLLVASYNEIVCNHELYQEIDRKLKLIDLPPSAKYKELLLIWEGMIPEKEIGEENLIMRGSPFKRKLSTSRNISSGRSKRPRALRDLTNIN
ncbi:hypothetical protein FOA43_001449 [Brettanomyces nanus]|uniref:Uncharacterized protein n=1 Tax=Eeniella nana TaxID=13502 RepID=A0A875RU27_EENNA|nr:uncharacterized protein FOA43_001449 [Brettanomyces nanus]QPG74127.1 hypothetical protein FOA43_001449 [Brettanomyces nanus]